MFNELVQKAKDGDPEARGEIIKRLQPLLVASIRRYYNKREEYEDLMQDGNLTILESIKEYDSRKGVYFLGFIKSNIKFLYLNKHKQKFHQSLNEKIGDGETESIDLLEGEEIDFLGKIIKEENNEELKKGLEVLTKRQKQIMDLFYGKNMTLAEIAEHLGISYRTVVNIRVTALEKLRKEMMKNKI